MIFDYIFQYIIKLSPKAHIVQPVVGHVQVYFPLHFLPKFVRCEQIFFYVLARCAFLRFSAGNHCLKKNLCHRANPCKKFLQNYQEDFLIFLFLLFCVFYYVVKKEQPAFFTETKYFFDKKINYNKHIIDLILNLRLNFSLFNVQSLILLHFCKVIIYFLELVLELLFLGFCPFSLFYLFKFFVFGRYLASTFPFFFFFPPPILFVFVLQPTFFPSQNLRHGQVCL